MNKIIKGDQVVVITGKDKGKQGQVVRVLGGKVVVEGINVVKRHQKPRKPVERHGSMVMVSPSLKEGSSARWRMCSWQVVERIGPWACPLMTTPH